MKYLIVTYKCKTGKREDYLKAIQAEGIDKASQGEAGNIRYAYSKPIDDKDTLILLETWKSEDAFNEHCATQHFKRLGQLKNEFVEDTILEKFDK